MPPKKASTAKTKKPPANLATTNRSKQTGKRSANVLAPRKQLVRKQLVKKATKKQQLDRVSECREWWDELRQSQRDVFYRDNAFGYEGHRHYPVDTLIPLQPPPPRTGRLSRLLTPGTRGPAKYNPIVCGWCDLTLANMYDAFDHNLMERQTHALQCCLPKGIVDVRRLPINEYEECGTWFATRASQRSHVGNIHGVKLTALKSEDPAFYRRLLLPLPCHPDFPYYCIVQKSYPDGFFFMNKKVILMGFFMNKKVILMGFFR